MVDCGLCHYLFQMLLFTPVLCSFAHMTRMLALFPVFLFFFTSCGKEEKNSNLCVFRYNQPNAVTSLDPAFARNQSNIWAVDHLYNTLIQLDDSLHLQPCLAKRWESTLR